MGNDFLEQTVDLMLSEDYKERFKAEYYQLYQRFNKLRTMLIKWDRDELDFIPNCPRGTYDMQLEYMYKYLAILECRAKIEEIDIAPIELAGQHRLVIE